MAENEVTRQSSTIQVIDRASSLIDIISQYGQPVALKTLYTETGLNPATTHRILSSLWKNGMVQRTGAGLYDLGPKLNTMSQDFVTRRTLLAQAEPVMKQLWAQTQSKVQLVERDGRSVVCVAECEGNDIIFRALPPEPLHTTAVGKLFLGYFGETVTRTYVERTTTTERADHALTSFSSLWQDVQSASQQGYAVVEQTAGTTAVGALVKDATDVPVAGISLSSNQPGAASQWLSVLEDSCQRLTEHLCLAQHAQPA